MRHDSSTTVLLVFFSQYALQTRYLKTHVISGISLQNGMVAAVSLLLFYFIRGGRCLEVAAKC